MREVLAAGEEANERTAPVRHLIADRSRKHRVRGLERVEDGALRGAVANIERDFGADAGERSQVRGQLDAYPGHIYLSVCTSTDITAGRSWTIAVQLSPPFADP